MEKRKWHFQELNQCQMYDVIRMADVARLVTAADGVPYVTPMHYQWQLDGCTSIFHFAGAAHGRRFDALCGIARAAVEIEQKDCTGISVIIAEGIAMLHVCEEEDAAWITVTIHTMTGRRYFMA